ncbi:Superoxide dismutase [Cu-Zn] [Toxocara canis]|uniref:Superoxide dismutase [Cu-Zn] n=1 Tax=Toxocara canis TaxID=6265 RepID=A0A0B2W3X2_TOXCA|nr:Superoxide dismutase [Cu-Zn] [Toxocara canis]
MNHLFPSSILMFVAVIYAQNYKRICENQGTCVNCGENRYSYYKCQGMHDCFAGERCTEEGFCCPVSREQPSATALLETGKSEVLRPTPLVDQTTPCPDGSTWLRPCVKDSDCIFGDEICAEGKCCAACNQRRRQVLDELPTNDVLGIHIPQCETNGKYYRAEQCRAGTEECWCVSQFGRMIGSLHSKSNDFGLVCRVMRNSISSEPTWQNEQQILKKLTNRSELRRKQESINPVENRLTLLLTGDDFKTSDKIFNDNRVKFSGEELKKDGGESWEGFTQIIEKNTSQCNLIKDGVCRQQHSIGDDENSTTNCECDSDCFGNQKCCPTGNNSSTCYEPTDNSPSAHLVTCGINEQYVKCFDPCQPTCTSNSSTPCPPRECRGGCHCRQGFIRRNTDPHSRCVPLSECSMESIDVVGHCTDSLREYLACGPACPISCATRNIPRELCNKKCKPGCFCKIPYIVENDADPINSRCILPAQCAHVISSSERLSSPLAPIEFEHVSVVQPLDPNAVQPSSHSVEYVMPNVLRYIDPYDNWPSAHSQVFQCIDPLKNFQACGSACPVGCNSRIGGLCSERCVSGCFCRSPYILQDANNLNSGCLLPQQCSAYTSNQQTCSDPRKQWTSCFSVHCARSCANPVAACSSHDCAGGCTCRDPYVLLDARDPNSRCKCCRTSSLPFVGSQHQRCTCSDPYAIWKSCGSLCPEYCGQPSVPVCSSTCNPGCHCAPGYVKARNDVTAPCVAKAQCLLSANRDELDESTTKPSDPFDAKSLASVQIFDRDGRISGRLRFSRYGDDKMRIKGTVYGVPPGEHALAIHQYGDTSDACSHVGPTLLLDDGRNASAILGNIRGEGSADDEIAKIIDLESVSPIIGRSLVIHAMSVNDWSLQDKDVAPLACGIIGLTSQ